MKSPTTLLCVAMACLGMITGALVGLSESPVVATVLPLLFGLLGGASGYFVLKTDMSATGPVQGITVYALTIIAFSFGFAGGAWWGVGQRTAPTSWSLVRESDASSFTLPPVGSDASESVRWLAIDSRLHRLGLTPRQRSHFLARLHASMEEATFVIDGEWFDQMRDWLAKATPPAGTVMHEDEWSAVGPLLDDLASEEDGTGHAAAVKLAELRGAIGLLSDDADDVAHLSSTPVARAALDALTASVEEAQQHADGGMLAAVDEALRALLDATPDAAALFQVGRSIASIGEVSSTDA